MSTSHSHVDLTFWINLAKANSAGKVPISLRITIFGKRVEISTKIRCFPSQWDKAAKRLIPKDRFDHATLDLNTVLDDLEAKTRLTASDVRRAADDKHPYTAAAVREALMPPPPKVSPCVLASLDQAITTYPSRYTQAGRHTVMRVLREYLGEKKTLPLDTLTPEYVEALKKYLLATRQARATKQYLDMLRALYNRAFPSLINPFATKGLTHKALAPSKPRYALTKTELSALARVSLSGIAAIARDVYMTQYYLHGSRVGVVLELSWSQVDWKKGRVKFKAEKGGGWHDVALRPALACLLRTYYPDKDAKGPVFPMLPQNYDTLSPDEQFRLRKSANAQVWEGLQVAAKKIGLPGRLHSHTARHTLATHTVQATGNFRLAQQLLGHTDLAMTERYVKSMLPTELDAGADAVYDTD